METLLDITMVQRPSAMMDLFRQTMQDLWKVNLARGRDDESFNISECLQVEDALRQALVEKDALMREFQHRVKNSLAIVTSMIAMQEMSLNNEQDRAILTNIRSRIEAISAVYEQLYSSGGIDQINLRHYMLSLVEGLSRSYISAPGAVGIETQLDDIQFDIKRAMPLGLILNELVVNALKYAFPAGTTPTGGQGVIRVELSSTNDYINLCVTDNGVGFPAGEKPCTGTGFELIRMLTRQLNGTLSIENTHGVTVRIRFKQK